MTTKAIQLAKECGDVETDRRGRETYSFDNYGIERLVARAQAQALREAADEILRMADYDPAAGALQAMAAELESKE